MAGGRDIRERILDSALTLFSRQGIAASSIAEIAALAGVNTAMIHYYFRNKEGLVESVVNDRLRPCLQHVWFGINDEELASPRLLVCGMVDRFLDVVEKVPELPALWSREIINAGGALRQIVMQLIPRDIALRVKDAIQKAQMSDIVPSGLCPELLITTIMGTLMLPLAARSILEHIYGSELLDRKALREHALTILLNGICR